MWLDAREAGTTRDVTIGVLPARAKCPTLPPHGTGVLAAAPQRVYAPQTAAATLGAAPSSAASAQPFGRAA